MLFRSYFGGIIVLFEDRSIVEERLREARAAKLALKAEKKRLQEEKKRIQLEEKKKKQANKLAKQDQKTTQSDSVETKVNNNNKSNIPTP